VISHISPELAELIRREVKRTLGGSSTFTLEQIATALIEGRGRLAMSRFLPELLALAAENVLDDDLDEAFAEVFGGPTMAERQADIENRGGAR
jgi:hypothetical protein